MFTGFNHRVSLFGEGRGPSWWSTCPSFKNLLSVGILAEMLKTCWASANGILAHGLSWETKLCWGNWNSSWSCLEWKINVMTDGIKCGLCGWRGVSSPEHRSTPVLQLGWSEKSDILDAIQGNPTISYLTKNLISLQCYYFILVFHLLQKQTVASLNPFKNLNPTLRIRVQYLTSFFRSLFFILNQVQQPCTITFPTKALQVCRKQHI